MASYPTSVAAFATHKDGDVVQQADYNNIAAEVAAIESTLGTMPHVSVPSGAGNAFTASSTNWGNVTTRVANAEYGLASDQHASYVKKAGGSIVTPAADKVGLSIKAPASSAVDQLYIASAGGGTVVAVDPSLTLQTTGIAGTPVDAAQSTSAQGTDTRFATVDHQHYGGIYVTSVSSPLAPSSPAVGRAYYAFNDLTLRAWNGTEWWCPEENGLVYNKSVTAQSNNNTVNTWNNCPSPITATTFQKQNTASKLRVVIMAVGWTSGATVQKFGVEINNTIYEVAGGYRLDGQLDPVCGGIMISNIAAGSVSLQPIYYHAAYTFTLDKAIVGGSSTPTFSMWVDEF